MALACLCAPRGYACSECGGALTPWGRRLRRVVTAEGEASFRSVRYRCRGCGSEHAPLEESNGLSESQFTPAAKGRIAQEAVVVPFACAAERLRERGIAVSPKQVDRIVREVASWRSGEEQAVVEAAFAPAQEVLAEADDGSPADRLAAAPSLHTLRGWSQETDAYIGVDGAKVRSPIAGPFGLEWFEDRAAVIADATDRSQASKIYLGGVLSADALFDRLSAVWRQMEPAHRRLLFGADGADWIWERVRLYFPEAIQVLDIYHAGEHVGSAASACWGDDHPTTKLWRRSARQMLLSENGARSLLHRLIQQLRSPGELVDAQEARKEFRYLWRHRHRMPYKWLSEQGLPTGSGVMESAIKQVSSQRLRQPGMMWSTAGADAMLCLRAAYLSGSLSLTLGRKRQALRGTLHRYGIRALTAAA